MSRSELRRERNRDFFINAARSIVESEGLQALTIRKVSEMAGYSAASVYNYFGSMNSLLNAVKDSYAVDIMKYISQSHYTESDPVKKLEHSYRAFAEYLLQKPEIFRLIFMSQVGRGEFNPDELPNFLDMGETRMSLFLEVAKENGLRDEVVTTIENTLSAMLFGNLYFYNFGLTDMSPELLLQLITNNVSFLFETLGGKR